MSSIKYLFAKWQHNFTTNKLHDICSSLNVNTKRSETQLNHWEQMLCNHFKIGQTYLTCCYLLKDEDPLPCISLLTVGHILINCVDVDSIH